MTYEVTCDELESLQTRLLRRDPTMGLIDPTRLVRCRETRGTSRGSRFSARRGRRKKGRTRRRAPKDNQSRETVGTAAVVSLATERRPGEGVEAFRETIDEAFDGHVARVVGPDGGALVGGVGDVAIETLRLKKSRHRGNAHANKRRRAILDAVRGGRRSVTRTRLASNARVRDSPLSERDVDRSRHRADPG